MTHLPSYLLIILLFTITACDENNSPIINNNENQTVTKLVENIIATEAQKDRRKKSEKYCTSQNIPIYKNENSLFVESDENVTIITKDEIVDRALSLLYLGLKSEGLEQEHLNKLDKDYNICSNLSGIEKEYVYSSTPSEQQKIDANWRYESLHVLLWALSYIDSLDYPNEVCNVAEGVQIIFELTETEFRVNLKLRTKKVILDQADLILRLDWACVNARINNEDAPNNLDPSVVYERHYSLNWLINNLNQDWDNVTTDT